MTTNRKTVIVDSTNPADGYVVTYSAADGYYKALPAGGGTFKVITVSSPGQTLSNTDMFLRVRMIGAGANAIFLPGSPTDGMNWIFKDRDGYAASYAYTINPSGKKIDMSTNTFTLPYSGSSLYLVYCAADNNWEIT